LDFDEARASALKHRFLLLDGDSEACYEGLSGDCESTSAFDPLDDFGRGYAGCTEIQYFENGCWMSL